MRAFVTGANGFVGTHVVRALLAKGTEVRALVREVSDLRNLQGLDVELVYGDLRDGERLAPLLRGCDELYHVAALYSTRPEDGPLMYEVNVQGTKHILRAALANGVRHVVHTSTIGTIGRPADGSLPTEATPFNLWDTASDYVKSKYLGEQAALAMAQEGLPVVVVHPTAPVGAYDLKPTSTGQRIVDYLHGKLPSFAPGGINHCAVRDVAQGHLLAARRGRVGERYILGHAAGNLQLADFVALMAEISGIRVPLPRMPLRSRLRSLWRRAGETGHRPLALTCDPTKAIRELGLPQTPLRAAFAEAVAWFIEHGYVRG